MSMATEAGRENIRKEVMSKIYFHTEKAYLVLSEEGVFTIGYDEHFITRQRTLMQRRRHD